MFYKDSRQLYRVTELEALEWLVHGFGTRQVDIPAMFGELAFLKQVHSADCVTAEGRTGEVGTGDALLEDRSGAIVSVKTADCVPILLVDERRRALAAVHAGWRGTVARIAARALEAMHARFGTEAADVHAAIGPCIGKCCYEVGAEVATRFGEQDRAHIDLAEANRLQLGAAGVPPERICVANLCTMCHAAEFHSYRRDREGAGRLYSFVGIR